MPSLDSVCFDTTALECVEEATGVRAWSTQDGDIISVHYFDIPPNIEADIDSIDDYRAFLRRLATDSPFGIIETVKAEVDGCRAIKAIVKIPQQPAGMTYVGSWSIPFRDFSFVLKLSCEETGMTGAREAMLMPEIMQAALAEASDPKPTMREWLATNWTKDPYDAELKTPLTMNLAEAETYDERFPDHPLSRLRRLMERLGPSLAVADEVKNMPPFEYSP